MSEKDPTIKTEARNEFGKGAARRIRRDNKIPAVLYGHGGDPIHVTLPGHDTMLAIKRGGANSVLNLEIDGKVQLGLAKQIQADPIKGFIEHIDFAIVKKGEKVTVEVPVLVVGEAKSDAMVVTELGTITLEAEATNIPEHIEVSVQDAEAGTMITVADLAVPAGATVHADSDLLVINVVHAPTAEEVDAELDAAEAEAGIEHDAPESADESAAASDGEGDEG